MTAQVHASIFRSYWRRMNLREQAMAIPAPCVTWQRTPHFNQVESLIWQRVKGASRILDFGSGDQSLREKFLAAGYTGRYETFDVSPEFPTTWSDPDQIRGPFDAVICLEVIEHMPLAEGLALRERLLSWLAPDGWLILSTPNPACITSPFAADETHLHLYPLRDLLVWALAEGLMPEAWRVKQIPERVTPVTRLRLFVQRILCYLIGADRADGLLLIARRPGPEDTQRRGLGSSPTGSAASSQVPRRDAEVAEPSGGLPDAKSGASGRCGGVPDVNSGASKPFGGVPDANTGASEQSGGVLGANSRPSERSGSLPDAKSGVSEPSGSFPDAISSASTESH